MESLYFISTILYCIFEFFIWMFKIADWQTTYKRCKFRCLFRVYDLGLIIFPWSILVVLLVMIICFVTEIFENPKMYPKIKSWINKPLFKDKEVK